MLPLVLRKARVVLVRVVAATAAASVCGPAAVPTPSAARSARVSGGTAAPAGVELAVVARMPPAVAWTARLVDAMTAAASSMKASVVTMTTGAATVVPMASTAVIPSATLVTTVFVAAAMLTAPPALSWALSDRLLRAVVLITGLAVAISPMTTTTVGVAVAVATTLDVALAVKVPLAVIAAAPVTATVADTFATSAAAGSVGRLTTEDTRLALALSAMLPPLSVAPSMRMNAATLAIGSASGVGTLPTAAMALNEMFPAATETPGLTMMPSALMANGLPPRVTLPLIVTSSWPASPLTMRAAFRFSACMSRRSVSEITGMPKSPPRSIVSELVGLVKVMLSNVGIASVLARVSWPPSSVRRALSVLLLVRMTRSVADALSKMGSSPA